MPKLKVAQVVDEDEDLDDIEDIDEDEDAPVAKKKKAPLAVADDDEDDEDDEDEEDEDSEEDDEEDDEPVARKPPPVATPARRIVVAPPPGDEDVSDTDFDAAAKKRKAQQKVDNFLERKRSEETTSVDEITELMMNGDTDKILHELVQYCADNSGIKKAKQLLREARDRAKARVTRIAGVVSVMLDELKSEDDKGEY